MSDDKKPREFWLQDCAFKCEGLFYARQNQQSYFNVHVIEYSAYLAEKERADREYNRRHENYEEYQMQIGRQLDLSQELKAQYDQLKADADKLVEALRHIQAKKPMCEGCACAEISLLEHYDCVAEQALKDWQDKYGK